MRIKTKHNLGSHLTIDGFYCSKEKLDDEKLIKKIMNELPDKLGMKKLNEPVVIRHTPKIKEERGITAFIVIAESHISLHTYPEKGYLSADIFSCREFDIEFALNYFKEQFEIKKLEKNIVKRGHSETLDES